MLLGPRWAQPGISSAQEIAAAASRVWLRVGFIGMTAYLINGKAAATWRSSAMLSWFSSWKKRAAFVAGMTFWNFLKYFRFSSVFLASRSKVPFANSAASLSVMVW